MRRLTTMTLALLLSACAITPTELRRSPPAGIFVRPTPIGPLADCLERALRNTHGNVGTYRDVISLNHIDVGGRMEDYGAIVILEISALESGSRVYVYLHSELFNTRREELAYSLVGAC
jgi:hypothetical protein